MPTPESTLMEKARGEVIELQQPLRDFKQEQADYQAIKQLLAKQDAVLITHYYTSALLQQLAEETGGFIGDSLEMARFGQRHQASTLVVGGVKFMGETAKILSPEKRVIMPHAEANCSLDLGCPADEFKAFCEAHPDRTVVVYANTSAAVKALADWCVTSSVALDIVRYLDEQGEKVLWAPDRHLGAYIARMTGVDMVSWQGACIVHETFKLNALLAIKAQYPEAAVLVHPEAPEEVLKAADFVGSTSQILRASQEMPHQQFIVGTERGIFYKMQQASPHKQFIQLPSGGAGATCHSCIHCPWMGLNTLTHLRHTLENGSNDIEIAEEIREQALIPLQRMVEFGRVQSK